MIKGVRYLLVFAVLMTGCNRSIEPENLHGQWKYVKVETPSNPEENVSAQELAEMTPFIRFTKQNDLVIMWGGKKLSHGKFKIEGNLIRYKENLGEGKFREFPFLISKLTADELVFETMSREGTRVTAIKQ